MALADLASVLRHAVGDRDVCLTHVSLSWHGALWDFRHPLDYIGSDGGAGMGAGPGISVGAALALSIAVIERGGVAVVDARIIASYSAASFAAQTRGSTHR